MHMNSKKMKFILAGVALVVLAVVLFFVLGGGGAKDDGHIDGDGVDFKLS